MTGLRVLLLGALLLCGAPVLAEASPEAQSAYDQGRWGEAEQLASAHSDDIEALILAADAALAPLTLGQIEAMSRRDKRAAAQRAQEYAQTALSLEPDNAQAHLRLAAGLGYESRYVSRVRAVMSRLPQQGRDHMIEAIALDPDEPWGPAMLGAWHMEVARRAGEGMFDASLSEGRLYMRQAVAMETVEVAILYRVALALIAEDPVSHSEDATILLNRVQAEAGATAQDQAVLDLAVSLFEDLQTTPENAQAEAVARLEE